MKNVIFIVIFSLYFVVGFSQIKREVQIKPFIDTTTVEFKGIFSFWKEYMDTLNYYNLKSRFKIKEPNESINSYWCQSDIEQYNFPDLIYSSYLDAKVYYPIGKEYFLGFAYRDSNLFEIKTMFLNINKNVHHNTPIIIFTQPVIKIDNEYKLYNNFSLLLEEKKIIKQDIGSLTYYYSPSYNFNIDEAKVLNKRIEKFKKDFNVNNNTVIKYIVANNMSEVLNWFGVDYSCTDYAANLSNIQGQAISINNMILSGGGGENYMHEIIHILLEDIRQGNYFLFEEGIACFFGDHVMHDYYFHIKRLKIYLENNQWIDLSKNLKGYYKNDIVSHSYEILDKQYPTRGFRFYSDNKTNFTYIIHAVLCEIAFHQGGYEKVIEILSDKANNLEEFYIVIENKLGIKQKNLNNTIRQFINENY